MAKSEMKAASRWKMPKAESDELCCAVLAAAEAAGKQFGDEGLVSYLQAQAVATPSPFLTLLSKVMANERQIRRLPVTRIEIVAPQTDSVGEKETDILPENEPAVS